MAGRYWTLVVVSEENCPVRQIRLTRTSMRILVGCALLLFAAASGMLASALFPEPPSAETRRLERRNEVLTGTIDTLNQHIAILQESIAGLEQKDDLYRLIAGLEPFDADVRRVGIGGPGDHTVAETPLWEHDRRTATSAAPSTAAGRCPPRAGQVAGTGRITPMAARST